MQKYSTHLNYNSNVLIFIPIKQDSRGVQEIKTNFMNDKLNELVN